MSERVAIVGAGLAGSLLGVMLGRRGHAVDLYERRSDPRVVGAERGRSINLAISTRGLEALSRIDLKEAVLDRALPMRGRMLHLPDGHQEFHSYSVDGQRAINSISRGELNAVLLDAAEAIPGVTVHFEHRLADLDLDSRAMAFATPRGEVQCEADVVLGTDGAYSVVRRHLMARDSFDYRQDYLPYGYKELTIPARDGDFALDPGALHIWPRGSSMMIALPNLDRSFTCTLFWPKTGEGSFAALRGPSDIREHFARTYPDAAALMPDLVEDYELNPIGSLVTVRCAPWTHGRVGLLGDAAHAIVPFYGQGANASFEDCVSLLDHLEDTDDDWDASLAGMAADRKPQSDAIADLALHNFVEMRDSVTSSAYRAVRGIEHALHRVLGDRYRTRYEMVSFTTTPYADIEPTVRRQRIAAGAVAAAGVAALAGAATMVRRGRRG